MEEEKGLQVLELADGVVGGLDSLLTLEPTDTNPDMRRVDHIDIVSTVTDCQSRLLCVTILDQKDDFCLLFWGDTASKDHICALTEVHK